MYEQIFYCIFIFFREAEVFSFWANITTSFISIYISKYNEVKETQI